MILDLCAEGPVSRAQGYLELTFICRMLSSLSIAPDVKLEDALYSVFYVVKGKRPCTFLNKWGMCQNPNLLIIHLIVTLEDAT